MYLSSDLRRDSRLMSLFVNRQGLKELKGDNIKITVKYSDGSTLIHTSPKKIKESVISELTVTGDKS